VEHLDIGQHKLGIHQKPVLKESTSRELSKGKREEFSISTERSHRNWVELIEPELERAAELGVYTRQG